MGEQEQEQHHHRRHHQQLFNNNNLDDPNFERKLDLITDGAKPFLKEHLLTRISRENCLIIIAYILVMQTEINPSERYRIDTIHALKQLAEFHKPKSFHELTRQNIVDYLDRLRKPEQVDPLHKWIGTYELTRIRLLRFFKWLYSPDTSPSSKRPKPDVMDNIPKIKRREISTYKPTDLWTEEDDVLFYKYCPSVRDRCWHAVSRDTACRPHELLKLKIKDIVVQQLDNGYQVARITVNGKTGTRHVRLNNSYPRLKEWLSTGHHPYAGNPNAPLFCGIGKKNTGKKLSNHTIYTVYDAYKKERFPKLLQDPLVPEEDKRKIRELIRKPWNPYIRRHSAATEISKVLKDSVLIDQYMGWSHAGNTRQKYQHYYNDDSFDAMLTMMDGFAPSASSSLARSKKGLLRPKQCPNCAESNKPEAKFCAKCKFVLSFDAFNEAIKSADEKEKELEQMRQEHRTIMGFLKLAAAKLHQVDNFMRVQKEVLRERNAEMEKYLTEEQLEKIEKELQEENEQAAREGIDETELLRRELGSLTKNIKMF